MKKYFNVILQFICLIIFSMGLVGCTTYYIPLDSFKQQFKGIDSTNLKMVVAIGPYGEKFSYPANTIDTIYCYDGKNKLFKLINSPSIEIRFTYNKDENTIFYFDTVFLKDSMIIGAKSRFLPTLRDTLPLNNIKLIEVQDGKKKFSYDNNN